MNIRITTFKNLPLKLRIIGYFLAIYAFAILFIIFYIVYTGKFDYALIISINVLVLAISSLLFVTYRIKRR